MPTAIPKGRSLSNQELPANILIGLDLQTVVKNACKALTSTKTANQAVWLHTHAGGLACCLQGTFIEAKTVAEQL